MSKEKPLDLFPNIPDNIKKYVLDENGNVPENVKKFMSFFTLINNVFESHFIGIISKLSSEETWDVMSDPAPFINQVCSSFLEKYEKEVVSKLGDDLKENLIYYLPDGYIKIIHKKYVISSIMSLPNSIMSLEPDKMLAYYRDFCNDYDSSNEEIVAKLITLINDFTEQVENINDTLQYEWRDHILDAYNKKQVTKEMMEFIMSRINDKKRDE